MPEPVPTPNPEHTQAQTESAQAAQQLEAAIATHEWQRTSLWTLLNLFGNVAWIFVLYFLYQFAKIGVSIGLPPDLSQTIADTVPFLTPSVQSALVELLVPVVIALTPMVQWWSLRWRLDEQTIELRRGILWKTHQRMARSRVQTVSLKADIIGRITNTRSVVISSGDTEDIVISLVALPMAEQLRITVAPRLGTASQPLAAYVHDPVRDAVIRATSQGPTPAQPGGPSSSVEHLLGTDAVPMGAGGLERTDIVRLGVRDWIKFVTLNAAPHVLITTLWLLPVIMVAIMVASSYGVGITAITALLGVQFLLMAIPIAFGIAGSQLATWGFTSWIQEGRIHSVQGLVSRLEKGANLSRLQTLSVGQNPLRLWLKLDEINVTTADAAMNVEQVGTALSLVHPLLPAGQWRTLAEQLLHVTIPDQLNPPSRLTIYRGIVRTLQIGIPCVALAAGIEYVMVGSVKAAIILLIITLLVAYPVGLWRFNNLRWAINDDCFVIRRGLFFRKITVVPLNLVQNVLGDATFFQRRLGLGDVDADVAGLGAPRVRAHDLPIDQAKHIESVLIAHANQARSKDGV